MAEFQIEKGLPIPAKTNNAKYPWNAMEVSDSFFVPLGDRQIGHLHSSIHNSAKQQRPKRFRIMRMDGGIRAWRIE